MSDVILVPFDLTNPKFDDLATHLKSINSLRGSKGLRRILFLVGTKCDISKPVPGMQEQIKQMMEQFNIDAYVETSSKTGLNVNLVFIKAIEARQNQRRNASQTFSISNVELFTKERIQSKLLDYFNRVQSHETPGGNIKFNHGFYFFKNSRAANREANYFLAIELHKALSKPDLSLSNLFSSDSISALREQVIKNNNINTRKDYRHTKHVNSSELNSIIQIAQSEAKAPTSSIKNIR